MGMLKEFKEFAVKGNVMDLAVGVIIGAAFGKIVDSVVGDLIMPIVGRVVGGLDFSSFFIALSQVPAGVAMNVDALKKAGVPVFAYGSFITILINFIILAFIIFMLVRSGGAGRAMRSDCGTSQRRYRPDPAAACSRPPSTMISPRRITITGQPRSSRPA